MDRTYNSPLGEIVIIKNIVFKKDRNTKKQVDHAWSSGRPCLILYSDEEYDYYLTLTSSKERKNYFSQIKDDFYKLNGEDFFYIRMKIKEKN